jgi:hypothetical protein
LDDQVSLNIDLYPPMDRDEYLKQRGKLYMIEIKLDKRPGNVSFRTLGKPSPLSRSMGFKFNKFGEPFAKTYL